MTDNFQPRRQLRSSYRPSRTLVSNRLQQTQEYSNLPNHGLPSADHQFHSNNLQDKFEGTSSSEDEEFFLSSRWKTLRHLSDYETGESSDRSLRSVGAGMTTSRYLPESDSSSEDSIPSPRTVKKRKRPLIPSTTSDSSDSGVPIAFNRPVKRMRVLSNSEESSSGSSNYASDQNSRPDVINEAEDNVNDRSKTNPSEFFNVRNPTPETVENRISVAGPSFQSSEERGMAVSESESEDDLLATNHIVRGRRIPVIQSEDDSCSSEHSNSSSRHSSNSIISVGIDSRRIRRNAFTIQESESGPTINAVDPVSISHRRQVMGRNSTNPELGAQNVWRVTIQRGNTEDNDTVSNIICNRVRGRRSLVIENEDSSESDTDNYDTSTQNQGNENIINEGSNVYNLRRRRLPNNDERNTISNHVRERNVPLPQSEDESNSSDSDITPRTLSNRMIPIFQSDDSSSSFSSSSTDSDDSIPIRPSRRRTRQNTNPIVDDFEYNANDFNELDVQVSTEVKIFSDNDGHKESSSDTDVELEKCPICLVGFKLQEIGKPKSCDHKFCSACIKEWATKSNTCPVDRKTFDSIVIYNKIEGKVTCEQPVERPVPQDDDHDADFGMIEEIVAELFSDSSNDSTWYFNDGDGDGPEEVCVFCRSNAQPHRMISCDSCNLVYHLWCVNPPLRAFPTGNWFCSYCGIIETDTFSNSDSD